MTLSPPDTKPFPPAAIIVREETLSAEEYQRIYSEQAGNIRRVSTVYQGLGSGWLKFRVEYKRPLVRYPYAR